MAGVHARLYYHFVWSTFHRHPLLEEEVERHAYALIRSICERQRAEIHALGGVADHLHLLVSLPRTLRIADFMESVKGGSSRALNDARRSDTWMFRWQAGYGVFTVSPGDVPRVRRHIENQQEHHHSGKLWAAAEQTGEE